MGRLGEEFVVEGTAPLEAAASGAVLLDEHRQCGNHQHLEGLDGTPRSGGGGHPADYHVVGALQTKEAAVDDR